MTKLKEAANLHECRPALVRHALVARLGFRGNGMGSVVGKQRCIQKPGS
jgi:hypothetical protein